MLVFIQMNIGILFLGLFCGILFVCLFVVVLGGLFVLFCWVFWWCCCFGGFCGLI